MRRFSGATLHRHRNAHSVRPIWLRDRLIPLQRGGEPAEQEEEAIVADSGPGDLGLVLESGQQLISDDRGVRLARDEDGDD